MTPMTPPAILTEPQSFAALASFASLAVGSYR
jgi:hypothetical protein